MSAFETRETDEGAVALRARGATLGSVLAATANGVVSVRWPRTPATGSERHDAAAVADDPAGLLFDYLDELSYQRDVRGVVPVDNEASVAERGDRLRLSGSFRGVNPEGDPTARQVVAAADPPVARTDDGWVVELRLE